MKKVSTALLYFFPILILVLVPVFAYAQLIPCSGSACRACDVQKLLNTAIHFLIQIGGFVATILFMYAGFLLVTAGDNKSTREKAKEVFKNVAIGIIIILSGFMVVDTFLRAMVNPSFLSDPSVFISGRWWDIQCVENPTFREAPPDPRNDGVTVSTPGAGASAQGVLTPGSAASVAEAAALAAANGGVSSATGPGGGTVACAWMVNNILDAAGVAKVDANSVASMERELQAGRGTAVSDQSQARAGDIVVQAGQGHVGICQNDGCSRVISNSSGSARFNWVSDTSFAPSYRAGPGRIYRVN